MTFAGMTMNPFNLNFSPDSNKVKKIILINLAIWAVLLTFAVAVMAIQYRNLHERYEALTERVSYLEEQMQDAVLEDSESADDAQSSDVTSPNTEDVSEDSTNSGIYSHYLSNETEREYVERVVMQESQNQPYDGMLAVAQCILNTCIAENKSAYEVVTSPNQYANPYKGEASEEVKTAVRAVFDYGDIIIVEPIQYFYSTAKGYVSKWHETSPRLEYVCTIADHKFFKVK